ncbi:MAG: peptide deformylase [Saprospiraceae bacterium]
MILPVLAYGNKVLKKRAEEITEDHEGLSDIIANMWETMYGAQGVGLAAPQIGLSKRLFIVDTSQTDEEGEKETGIKQTFINPIILSEEGKYWSYEEGCLSIPNIREDVNRQELVRIRYMDENFQIHEIEYGGMNARVIQHEYDHLEGILFTDKIKPLKKRLIKRKLESIKKGTVSVDYRMKFKVI